MAEEQTSQTADEYISRQLQLEAEAREALPYQFDTCTQPLGPLRQSLFACLTCRPSNTTLQAGICYSCSISCHGEHDLVELFTKRDFVCDCGTTRLPDTAPCTLRSHPTTGLKGGVTRETPRQGNSYNHNFSGTFCACNETYDPHTEKGTMFQCLGLGTVEQGGCGEDWYHPECLMGISRASTSVAESRIPAAAINEAAEVDTKDETSLLPLGFPAEDDFDHLICYKCVAANPWIKQYAASPGFIALTRAGQTEQLNQTSEQQSHAGGVKRKAEDGQDPAAAKRSRVDQASGISPPHPKPDPDTEPTIPKHEQLPAGPSEELTLFLKEDFRDHFCKCRSCYPNLAKYHQLLEEEEAYEPPMSEGDAAEANGGGSVSAGSLLDRGEAALSTMDRMKAIEGVMAYNHLKDKVKTFLQPFAESGRTVGAEDVKAYFAKIRGDEEAMRLAAASAGGSSGDGGDNRREQSGY